MDWRKDEDGKKIDFHAGHDKGVNHHHHHDKSSRNQNNATQSSKTTNTSQEGKKLIERIEDLKTAKDLKLLDEINLS